MIDHLVCFLSLPTMMTQKRRGQNRTGIEYARVVLIFSHR